MSDLANQLPLSSAATIASYSITPPSGLEIEIAQAEHRIRIVNKWNIAPGSKVLELGCGQGTATAVLAELVGEKGHVDAVDPASPDYGAPFTLAQAQQHLTASAIGSRITWHRAVPEEFLKASKQKWDVVILLHCIWYFPSSKTLSSILAALHDKVGRVCIAEYALHATEKTAVPHVLAALARGTLESLKGESGENIRSPMSQRAITQIAEEASWRVASQSKIVPEAGLLDGTWEVGSVASDGFIEEVKTHVADERLSLVLQSARDATKAAVADLGAAKVQTMDVWVADFAPAV